MRLSKNVLAILPVTALLLTACGSAQAMVLHESSSTRSGAELLQVQQINTVEKSARPERTKLTPPCGDRVVKWIWEAGFRGQEVRVAWAIAQRESNGNPNESTYPDLGLMQLNAPSWQGSKYWPANIYDPVQSLKAVKKMVRDMGWQPWGLRVKNGNISYDFSSYGMWSSWHHQNWIVIPFEKYYAQFPKKCAKNL